jgi:hypothetical protein
MGEWLNLIWSVLAPIIFGMALTWLALLAIRFWRGLIFLLPLRSIEVTLRALPKLASERDLHQIYDTAIEENGLFPTEKVVGAAAISFRINQTRITIQESEGTSYQLTANFRAHPAQYAKQIKSKMASLELLFGCKIDEAWIISNWPVKLAMVSPKKKFKEPIIHSKISYGTGDQTITIVDGKTLHHKSGALPHAFGSQIKFNLGAIFRRPSK